MKVYVLVGNSVGFLEPTVYSDFDTMIADARDMFDFDEEDLAEFKKFGSVQNFLDREGWEPCWYACEVKERGSVRESHLRRGRMLKEAYNGPFSEDDIEAIAQDFIDDDNPNPSEEEVFDVIRFSPYFASEFEYVGEEFGEDSPEFKGLSDEVEEVVDMVMNELERRRSSNGVRESRRPSRRGRMLKEGSIPASVKRKFIDAEGRNKRYSKRYELVNKAKILGATEIETYEEYREIDHEVRLTELAYSMDMNGNRNGILWYGEKDGKYYYTKSYDVGGRASY